MSREAEPEPGSVCEMRSRYPHDYWATCRWCGGRLGRTEGRDGQVFAWYHSPGARTECPERKAQS